jgi:hypothetical protein
MGQGFFSLFAMIIEQLAGVIRAGAYYLGLNLSISLILFSSEGWSYFPKDD